MLLLSWKVSITAPPAGTLDIWIFVCKWKCGETWSSNIRLNPRDECTSGKTLVVKAAKWALPSSLTQTVNLMYSRCIYKSHPTHANGEVNMDSIEQVILLLPHMERMIDASYSRYVFSAGYSTICMDRWHNDCIQPLFLSRRRQGGMAFWWRTKTRTNFESKQSQLKPPGRKLTDQTLITSSVSNT